MDAPKFDAAKYKQASQAEWQQAAPGWHKWMPLLSEMSAKETEVMLDMAGIGPGMRVLDIAAGDGDTSLAAARRVGADGYVLATDIASNLLEYAQAAAEEAGLKNVETRMMDGEKLELEDGIFDAVICRQGLMLMPHPATAMAEIHRVLKPGGRAAALVFSTPDKNPWLAIPAKVAMEHAQMPPPGPGMPGIFSLSAPGALEGLFTGAGFEGVETHYEASLVKLESAAQCLEMVKDIAGAIHTIMRALSDEQKAAAWSKIENALAVFEGEQGFAAPTETIVVGGVKQ